MLDETKKFINETDFYDNLNEAHRPMVKYLKYLLKHDEEEYKRILHYWNRGSTHVSLNYTLFGAACESLSIEMVKFLMDLSLFDFDKHKNNKNNDNEITLLNIDYGSQWISQGGSGDMGCIPAITKLVSCIPNSETNYYETIEIILNHPLMIKYKNEFTNEYPINGHVHRSVMIDTVARQNDIKLLNIFFDKNKNISYKHNIMHLKLRFDTCRNICSSPFFHACESLSLNSVKFLLNTKHVDWVQDAKVKRKQVCGNTQGIYNFLFIVMQSQWRFGAWNCENKQNQIRKDEQMVQLLKLLLKYDIFQEQINEIVGKNETVGQRLYQDTKKYKINKTNKFLQEYLKFQK